MLLLDHEIIWYISRLVQACLPRQTEVIAGTDAEMVCPGGEVAFVSQMVLDSAVLRGSVHWYTSMVGKKSTLKAVKLLLRQHGATAVRTTELAQGTSHTSGQHVQT